MKPARLSRAERSEQNWEGRIPHIPEGLNSRALALWPDLKAAPTRKGLTKILRGTKREPDVRLEIISGLRRFSETRSDPFFAIAAIYISVIALAAAFLGETPASARWVLTALLVASGFFMFHFASEYASRVEVRRKQSFVWLRALEDELSRR